MYPNVSKKRSNVSKMYPSKNIASEKRYECKYCNKSYKYSQGLSKHIKYTCKKNEDEDLKELARLLNEQLMEKNKQIEKMHSNMQKQIDKLTTKLQIHNLHLVLLPQNLNYH